VKQESDIYLERYYNKDQTHCLLTKVQLGDLHSGDRWLIIGHSPPPIPEIDDLGELSQASNSEVRIRKGKFCSNGLINTIAQTAHDHGVSEIYLCNLYSVIISEPKLLRKKILSSAYYDYDTLYEPLLNLTLFECNFSKIICAWGKKGDTNLTVYKSDCPNAAQLKPGGPYTFKRASEMLASLKNQGVSAHKFEGEEYPRHIRRIKHQKIVPL
jgi:hypothetical protein